MTHNFVDAPRSVSIARPHESPMNNHTVSDGLAVGVVQLLWPQPSE